MKPKALFIGSIGTIAETSELQRQAYNQAMKENNVDWNWDKETYKELLKSSGGQLRLETLGLATNQKLSQDQIKKIHARKTEIAGELIKKHQIKPRPGMTQLIKDAQENGVDVAWVTTTGPENTGAILEAFDGEITRDDFDNIFHRDEASKGKPDPEIYKHAMERYNLKPTECIAVEDSINSVLASKGAGIFTVATLGDYHSENVENIADVVYKTLEGTTWSDLSRLVENQH